MKRLTFALILVLFLLVFTAARLPRCRPDQPIGGGPGPVPTPSSEDIEAILVDRVGEYSYNAPNTYCGGTFGNVDPVSLVVRLEASLVSLGANTLVEDHVAHHAGMHNTQGQGQYFRELGACVESEISLSNDESDWIPFDLGQWHARGHHQCGQLEFCDPFLPNTSLGALTPHRDDFVSCGHAVAEDAYGDGSGVSGFVTAREYITDEWLISGHHRIMMVQNWENTDNLQQCNGWLPQSDGVVYHLGLKEP